MNYIIALLLIVVAIFFAAITFALVFAIGYYTAASANFFIQKACSLMGKFFEENRCKRQFYQMAFDYSYRM